MSEKVKASLIKYGVSIGIGLLLAYLYVSMRDLSAQPLVEKYRILCDAFTIPGILLLMAGLLMSVSNTGFLDSVGYVVQQGLSMLIPGKGVGSEKYADYVERKRKNRVKGYGFLYISAALFLVLMSIFMILFYSVYKK